MIVGAVPDSTSAGVPSVGSLVSHPRHALLAGVEAGRPTVHVWDCVSGTPLLIATIDPAAADYGTSCSCGPRRSRGIRPNRRSC